MTAALSSATPGALRPSPSPSGSPSPAPGASPGPSARRHLAAAIDDRQRRVLVLVDDATVRRGLDEALRAEGLAVRATTDPASAEVLLRSYRPAVFVIDARHLSTSITRIALDDPDVRVVVHGADAPLRVAALRDGVDDAASPDCAPVEVALRCAVLARRPARRAVALSEQRLQLGRLTVDLGRRTISVDGHDVGATRLEFDLFSVLCRRPTEVCTRAQLLESVWGPRWVGDPHVVDVHLSNLRRKVREYAGDLQLLCTVRGVGFRLSDEILAADQAADQTADQA